MHVLGNTLHVHTKGASAWAVVRLELECRFVNHLEAEVHTSVAKGSCLRRV